jgi:uncharacterized damage-inducible protein DinB
MTYYGGSELAEAFRTVRRNTIQIAEDIPEDKYGFRATPESRSVAEELAHVATATWWYEEVHAIERKTFITFEDFGTFMGRTAEMEAKLTTKPQIVEALRTQGDAFARFLETMTAEQLAERVGFPPPVQPSTRTRFEMVLAAKEHEMHHRAKLMVIERLLGIVPHLTRARQERMAAQTSAPAAPRG